MRHLDLFSGIGGFALAARRVGWETVGFCEIEPYAQKVLRKHWPDVPIYEDVRTLDAGTVGHVDIITGGYPCQPFSVAGKRRGAADDRHLWPEFARLIRELKPSWVVGENVAGHINMGLDEVLADLEGEGYTWETFVIPACAVDAPHRRDRTWIVANAKNGTTGNVSKDIGATGGEIDAPNDASGVSRGDDKPSNWAPLANAKSKRCGETRAYSKRPEERPASSRIMANTDSIHAQRVKPSIANQEERQGQNQRPTGSQNAGDGRLWPAEPGVGRVANGIPNRVDRLRALGNAIVPQVAEVIFRGINEQS